MDQRQTLISSGIHLGAVRRLGETYSTEEYLVAVEAARDAGDGERYADAVLGPDVDGLLRGVEEDDVVQAEVGHRLNAKLGEPLRGLDVQRRADKILRERGIRPEAASQAEMLDALLQVSS